MLSDDILYIGAAAGLPAYSATNNDHYAALEVERRQSRTVLVRTTQSAANGLPPEATAGIITSRAASEAFFIDGTNRAMFRFTLLNHLCRDMEQVQDTTRPPDRIRQDVTRSPGGDSRVFLNNCIGCHSGMDPMAQAFAYYDFDETAGRLVYTPGQVQPKYLINTDNFKPGYSRPTTTGTTTGGHGSERAAGLGSGAARQRQRREVARPGARAAATRSRGARCRRCSATSASARRATRQDRAQVAGHDGVASSRTATS